LSNDQYAKYVVAKILQVIEPDLKQMVSFVSLLLLLLLLFIFD